MTSKAIGIFGSTVAALACAAVRPACAQAQDSAPAAEEQMDAELSAEIKYVEALLEAGYPDFTAPVIAATKAKWPESETHFFALEVRGLLAMGKFDEAEKRIAALPDREGSKFWAARLEVANNYSARGMKTECAQIYDAFFKKYPTPPKELRDFYLDASFHYGQILTADKNYEQAVRVYSGLLKQKISEDQWCMLACETCELYLRLADTATGPARDNYVNPCEKLCDELLWKQDKPIFFGRAVAMKAHCQLLRGKSAKAQGIIEDYLPQLQELHEQIVEIDPEGREGLRRLSPMPQCRYLLAEMLWKEAQSEYKKPKRDDEKIKSLMFGAKDSASGKRRANGCYNHAITVFVNYPESVWASKAGDLAEAIAGFAQTAYNAKIKTAITEEQRARSRGMQFKAAQEKFAENKYEEAVKDFEEALSRFPEYPESITAIDAVIRARQAIRARTKGVAADAMRLEIDAIEGYLVERFGFSKDRKLMAAAGDAVIRAALAEKDAGEVARATELNRQFYRNYRRHANAPGMAAGLAGAAQREGRFEEAAQIWNEYATLFPQAPYYAESFRQRASCLSRLARREEAIAALEKYLTVEKDLIKQVQGQMQLADIYKQIGFEALNASETNAAPEAVAAQVETGVQNVKRAIDQFAGFARKCEEGLKDPGLNAEQKAQCRLLDETALYLGADCWARLKEPAAELPNYQANAAKGLEDYLAAYPEGRHSTNAYVRLASIYTRLGDTAKSMDAVERLTKHFPESSEAKNAKPLIARRLIADGFTREGTDLYAEMLRTDGKYTASQFADAGEALIDAKSWVLANQAFEKAIDKAGTNQLRVVARARLGQAKSYIRQKNNTEARRQLVAFLEDAKLSRMGVAAEANQLMVEVASELGEIERDDAQRKRYFGEAITAVKKLRGFWRDRPQSELDRIDLMSAEVVVRRVKAEETMGLTEQMRESCGRAASMLLAFLQARSPSAEHPFEKMDATTRENLERALSAIVSVYARMGETYATDVLKHGQNYLTYFPEGTLRQDVVNAINAAKASGAKLEDERPVTGEPTAASESEAAAEPAAETVVTE